MAKKYSRMEKIRDLGMIPIPEIFSRTLEANGIKFDCALEYKFYRLDADVWRKVGDRPVERWYDGYGFWFRTDPPANWPEAKEITSEEAQELLGDGDPIEAPVKRMPKD